MTLSPLRIPVDVVQKIRQEGVAAYPNECCGILIGTDRDRTVERIVPMPNVFDSVERYHRFRIDPLTLARAEDEAATQGKSVIGFYHSHPDHPAKPSEYDRTHVPPWNYYSHIIIAIEKATAALMTCWVFNEETEQFDEQAIQTAG